VEKSLKPRILVIDDTLAIHEDFRKILLLAPQQSSEMTELEAAFLRAPARARPRTGFAIDSAFEGQEGLDRVRRALTEGRPYVLAFVDVRMPSGWDGIETAARLRQADPDLQMVICSAYADYSWEQIADKLGPGDGLFILKKPFDTGEVLQLAEALNLKWNLARQAKAHLADLDQILNQRAQVLNRCTSELRSVNLMLAQETARRSQTQARLSAFSTLGRRLNATRTVREACQVIVDTADQLLGWDACQVDLYAPATQTLTHVLGADFVDGRRKETFPDDLPGPPSPLARKAIQEGGQLTLETEALNTRPRHPARPPASILCVPIRDGQGVTGVLAIRSYNANAYDKSSLEILQALADHGGGALDRIGMRKQAETRSGISKDTAFIQKAQTKLERAHKQLVEVSRQAGSAEVATGVLHNAGNVLTSR
jgi:CheY-like chemotaxis protein